LRIIKVEKHHSPIKGREIFHEVKNQYNVFFPCLFQRGIFGELKVKGARRFFGTLERTRLTLFLGLTCT
jgi:hypothetical protein